MLPLSATTTSPAIPASSIAARALRMQVAKRVRLVEAGHYDRNLDWLSARAKLRNALRRILHAGARMTTAPRLLGWHVRRPAGRVAKSWPVTRAALCCGWGTLQVVIDEVANLGGEALERVTDVS